MRPENGAGQTGFTLIETVAALMLLALLVSIALPLRGPSGSRADVASVALRLAAVLDHARVAARLVSPPDDLAYDPDRRMLVSARSGPVFRVPAGWSLTLDRTLPCDAPPRRIRFHRDGTACGTRLGIASATAAATLTINPLTGAVRIDD
jgi:prepilin-type N-terminal cleavage/methylation domain-containing protein